ncbi:hypothetical protein WJS89_02785 [Sphingomicrobium sp. XHP0235]
MKPITARHSRYRFTAIAVGRRNPSTAPDVDARVAKKFGPTLSSGD